MRPKLIRRRRRFPHNRICLSDTPRSRAFIDPRLDSSTNYFREINIKRTGVVAPRRPRGKFAAKLLKEKRIRSTIISRREGETYSNARWMPASTCRLAALSRLHSECTCVVTAHRESDAYLRWKSISFTARYSFLCRRSLFFPPECHHFGGTFFLPSPPPPFSFVRSFYFARSTVLRKSFLKGGIYLFVHAVLLPLPSFSI